MRNALAPTIVSASIAYVLHPVSSVAILVKPKRRLDINVEDKSHLVYDTKYNTARTATVTARTATVTARTATVTARTATVTARTATVTARTATVTARIA